MTTLQSPRLPEGGGKLLVGGALAVTLIALHQAPISIPLAIFALLMVPCFYKPVGFVYLLIASALFVPELPFGPGISLNVVLIAGFGLAVLKDMALEQSWTVPRPQYTSFVFLLGIVGLLSLFKGLTYAGLDTVVFGMLYLGQWFLYLLLPVLVAFYLRDNERETTGVLSFTLFASAVMAVYLLGLFLLDVRPIETTIRIAGHRPLVAFWQQGNLAVGMFTSLTSLVAVGLAVRERRERVAGALVALAALCAFLTLATMARSAILGFVVGVSVVLVLEYRQKFLLIAVSAVPLVILLAPEWLVLRFTRSTFFWREVPTLGVEIPVGTLWKRINGWVKLLGVYANNPILGIGFSLSQERMVQLFGDRISPDNHYVAVLVETGIVGATVFFWWVRHVFWRLLENYREATGSISGLGLGMTGAFTALLVWGFFQGFYARWRVLSPLFIYIGVIYAAYDRPPAVERD